MKRLLITNTNYNIFQVDRSYLYKIANFIVRENYKHHIGDTCLVNFEQEIQYIYEEEMRYVSSSYLFVAEDAQGDLIGCIRVMAWDRHSILPIQKIFNIDPLKELHNSNQFSFWHVGRFAVHSCCNASSLILFKQLMMLAIDPIVSHTNSYMLAESDSKLLRIMRMLSIDVKTLGRGCVYLGSDTIPIYSSSEGLRTFYKKYELLLISENSKQKVV